ncbi:MAG: ABC transporter permease subunit [Rubrivivax sp.]|nr:ABC transporter permease subunit [Rubrivivax sp.]
MAAANQPVGGLASPSASPGPHALAAARAGGGARAAPRRIGSALLRAAPALTLAAFGLPIVAGLAGTALPAFGWLPSIGGHEASLAPWQRLFAQPGFATSLATTLFTGWVATLLSVAVALGWVTLVHHRPWARRLGRALAPLLATPHSALAIGFAFLIAPSGWLVRWVSPGLTGFELPPDVSTVGHPSGWPLVACLLLKEVPYLMLMALAALNQVNAAAQIGAARSLGYAPGTAALKVVLPQLYAQLRLPIYAVLAFSLTVVDVALVLGPGHPPTLAVLAVRWFFDPDVSLYFPAAAAALLLLALVLASVALWHGGERVVARVGRAWLARGGRRGVATTMFAAAGQLVAPLMALAALALAGMALWSIAAQWRYPHAWPAAWSLAAWQRQLPSLEGPLVATLTIGAAATLIALVLAVACLENEAARRMRAEQARSHHWLLYVPLVVPQVAFLFGAQVLLVRTGLDATWGAVVWAHLVFVLPYLFLSLADPWRAYDERYTRSALALGASRWRTFWRIKLPILLPPVAVAAAVAFAVSVGLYLPTLFAGSGRIATLTTEAVTLSAGADRRVIGVWALLQALLPMLAYALALAAPRLVRPRGGPRA